MDQWAREQIEALEKRVAALERQMGGGSEAAPVAPAPEPDQARPQLEAEIVRLLRSGKGVEAIQTYITRTGSDLTTAKAEVARIASGLSPQDFA